MTLDRLRRLARLATLFPPTDLAAAILRMGFVQADPIRAPARAQDLILRHRARGYRAGDLDRGFARLGLEEDFLYAYGFMPAAMRDLLHPRPDPASPAGRHVPTGLAADVLAFVQEHGTTHPRDLERRFGREREINGWGGFSQATTRALETLRHFGLLRVAGRRDGIRLYAPRPAGEAEIDPDERRRRVVLAVTSIMAPACTTGLRGALALTAHRNPGLKPLAPTLQALLRSGALEQLEAEGETYVHPAAMPPDGPVPRDVRLLAPFDPLVWERRRFEHLWGWEYRFEAYTPPVRRRMGYYAMPMLWGDRVIGWANVGLVGGKIDAVTGFHGPAPRSRMFRRALDAELARMERFLDRRHQDAGRRMSA